MRAMWCLLCLETHCVSIDSSDCVKRANEKTEFAQLKSAEFSWLEFVYVRCATDDRNKLLTKGTIWTLWRLEKSSGSLGTLRSNSCKGFNQQHALHRVDNRYVLLWFDTLCESDCCTLQTTLRDNVDAVFLASHDDQTHISCDFDRQSMGLKNFGNGVCEILSVSWKADGDNLLSSDSIHTTWNHFIFIVIHVKLWVCLTGVHLVWIWFSNFENRCGKAFYFDVSLLLGFHSPDSIPWESMYGIRERHMYCAEVASFYTRNPQPGLLCFRCLSSMAT